MGIWLLSESNSGFFYNMLAEYNYSIDKKRVEIKKLQKKGLDKTFVNMFMKLLEYVAQI